MPKVTTALLTSQGLYLQSYSRTEQALAHWIDRKPADQRREADHQLDAAGYRRTTEWGYCPIKSDGMRCSVVHDG